MRKVVTVILGIIAVCVIVGALHGGNNNNTSNFVPATADNVSSNSGADATIQTNVCQLVAQGYTPGEIIDALTADGVTNVDMPDTVSDDAANC